MTTPMTTSFKARRRLFTALVCALPFTPGCAEQYAEISWDDLVPRGWDPMKSIQRNNSAMLDSDPRTQQLFDQLREVWDNAPTVPALAGRRVRLPGYLVPLDETKDGLREFLLVPYYGACIHTPPPPANQIVHVRSQTPITGFRTMAAIWVSGTLELARTPSNMGVSGYAMHASKVTAYKATGRAP